MFRIISEVSAGPGWLPTGNMDKFMLWSSAWALSLFISLIQTQMKCLRRKLNSKMTHWRKSKWDCCRSSVYQTLYMQFQPPIQYIYIYLLKIYTACMFLLHACFWPLLWGGHKTITVISLKTFLWHYTNDIDATS